MTHTFPGRAFARRTASGEHSALPRSSGRPDVRSGLPLRVLLALALLGCLCQQAMALPPSWNKDSYGAATALENRRGPSPIYANAPIPPQRTLVLGNIEDDGGAASGNYSFSVPIVSFPGRGLPLSLALTYSSQLWSSVGAGRMAFDVDGDWPSPGWSLGFGKLLATTSGPRNQRVVSGLLISNNKSRQALAAAPTNSSSRFQLLRIPGNSLAQVEMTFVTEGPAEARLTDGHGRTVIYTNYSIGQAQNVLYPTRLLDANGNYITVQYVNRGGRPVPPMIASVTDTVGRRVNFHYDAAERLTSITAPGTESEDSVYARFVYSRAQTVTARAGRTCLPFNRTFDHLSGVIYPSNKRAIWVPMALTYGMVPKVWQATDVAFEAPALDSEPTIASHGREAASTSFDYPASDQVGCIQKSPAYLTRTASWRDSVAGAAKTAVSRFTESESDEDSFTVVTHPDHSVTRQIVSKQSNARMGLFQGQIRRVENVDPSGSILSSTDFEWETVRLLNGAPRMRSVTQSIDPLDRSKKTRFRYDAEYPSLVTEVEEWGYGRSIELTTTTSHLRDPAYVARRLLALPQSVAQVAAQPLARSLVEIEYDRTELLGVGPVTQHLEAYEPHMEAACIRWETDNTVRPPRRDCVEWGEVPAGIVIARGNPTKITRYGDSANRIDPVETSMIYDSTGNLRRTVDAMGAVSERTYDAAHMYSLLTKFTSGSPDPNSPLRVTSNFAYYLGAGMLRAVRDPDGRETSYHYAPSEGGWRPTLTQVTGTGATTWYHDDSLLSVTETISAPSGVVIQEDKVETDGLGNVRRVSRTIGNKFIQETEYDLVGRVERQSQPYLELPKIWTVWSYDGLGRPLTIRTPGNSVASTYVYDKLPLPTVIQQLRRGGSTMLATDPWGRQHWAQTNAQGQLLYSVSSNGRLDGEAASLGSLTRYEFDSLGRLRLIAYEAQNREFDYDDLGRLVGQALPEMQATLDSTGAFLGQAGMRRFSDVFQYDSRSNLVLRTDARGVRTHYIYKGDPLNRLHGIAYEIPPSHDASSKIQPAEPVSFIYRKDSPTRIEAILAGDATVAYDYDSAWRVSKQTTTHARHPSQPFVFDLEYDWFDRPTKITYPARYAAAGDPAPRREQVSEFDGAIPIRSLIDGKTLADAFAFAPNGSVHQLEVGTPRGILVETHTPDPDTGLPHTHKITDRAGFLLYGKSFGYYLNGPQSGISGQITSKTDLRDASRSQKFEYDRAGRLRQTATGNYASDPPDPKTLYQTYTYDLYGNREQVRAQRFANMPCGTIDRPPCTAMPADEIERDGVADLSFDPQTNRLRGPTSRYDAAGNVLHWTVDHNGSTRTFDFLYDAAGRLVQVSDGSGAVLEQHGYGHDRRRLTTWTHSAVSAIPPSIAYWNWLGNVVLSEARSLATLHARPLTWTKDHFFVLGRRVATETIGGRNYYINDSRGVSADIGGSSAVDVASHRLVRAFGTESPAETVEDDTRFTNYKRSFVTGIDYAVNRNYSAVVGRFTQPDPAGSTSYQLGDSQSLNAYTYARNDPVGRIDPLGLEDAQAECTKVLTDLGEDPTFACGEIIEVSISSDFEWRANLPPDFSTTEGAKVGSATDKVAKMEDKNCQPPLLAMSGGRGAGHPNTPKWNDPKYLELLKQRVNSTLDYVKRSGRLPNLGHWKQIHDSVTTAARNGVKQAMDIARPVIELGAEFGNGVQTKVIGSGINKPFFPFLIINPALYDKQFMPSNDIYWHGCS